MIMQPPPRASIRSTRLLILTTTLGVLHHTDHVLRVEHSGWPFTPDVTPFTYSLLIYSLVTFAFLNLHRPRRVALLVGLMLVLSGLAHTLLEHPHDQYGPWVTGHNLLHLTSGVLGVLSVTLAASLILVLLASLLSLLADTHATR